MDDAPTPKRLGPRPLDPNDSPVHVGVTMTATQVAEFRELPRQEHTGVPKQIRRDRREAEKV